MGRMSELHIELTEVEEEFSLDAAMEEAELFDAIYIVREAAEKYGWPDILRRLAA